MFGQFEGMYRHLCSLNKSSVLTIWTLRDKDSREKGFICPPSEGKEEVHKRVHSEKVTPEETCVINLTLIRRLWETEEKDKVIKKNIIGDCQKIYDT